MYIYVCISWRNKGSKKNILYLHIYLHQIIKDIGIDKIKIDKKKKRASIVSQNGRIVFGRDYNVAECVLP